MSPRGVGPGGTRTTPPTTPLSRANDALHEARMLRAEWMVALAEGLVTLDDLLAEALTDEGRPLRRIRLSQVLASLPEASPPATNLALERLAEFADVPEHQDPHRLTVGWLIDNRYAAAHQDAFAAALDISSAAPAAAFPRFGRMSYPRGWQQI